MNEKIISGLITHLKLGKPLAGRKRVPIGSSTEYKYSRWLPILSGWFDKPFDDLTEEDVDKFRNDLSKDVFRRKDGKPFEINTKRDIEVKMLKTLLTYLNKPELALFVTPYKEYTEIPSLCKEDIEKLVSQCKLREKVIFQILFDGGFRASEFLNIKYRDISDDNLAKDGYYKIRITRSKTIPRTVGLTLPLTTDILKEWLDMNKDKIGTSQPLVDISYRHFNLIIRRMGLKILKQKIIPHQLRHSSATYYCHYLTTYQMCKRYGWRMSSNMPQLYIDREGVDDEKINSKVVEEETLSFRKEVNALKEQLNSKNEYIRSSEERMNSMQKRMEGFDKKIKLVTVHGGKV